MERVLLVIADAPVSALLAAALQDSYEVVQAADTAFEQPFDLRGEFADREHAPRLLRGK